VAELDEPGNQPVPEPPAPKKSKREWWEFPGLPALEEEYWQLEADPGQSPDTISNRQWDHAVEFRIHL
jgi:hypothetical protein